MRETVDLLVIKGAIMDFEGEPHPLSFFGRENGILRHVWYTYLGRSYYLIYTLSLYAVSNLGKVLCVY